MARRRREDKEPELGFEVPTFDEAEFIRKETISFRTTLILLVYSVLTAFASFLVWVYSGHNWFLTLFVGLGLGIALRWLYPALKVDVAHFQRKEWTGTGFLYFFSWLAFIIFLTNPPLYDGVPPTIEIHVTPDAQEPGAPVNITLIAYDNIRVDPATVDITVDGPGGPIAVTDDFTANTHPGSWSWQAVPPADGTYTVTARIRDVASGLLEREPHTATATATFTIGDVLSVQMSGGGTLATVRDAVTVTVPATVDAYRVWLQAENTTAETDRVLLQRDPEASDDERQVWYATPDFRGFKAGENRFTVHVAEHDSYYLAARYDVPPVRAELVSDETYVATISDAALLGDKDPTLPRERPATPAQTPGPELALILVGLLVAAVLIARARRAA